MEIMSFICRDCGEEKSVDGFYIYKDRGGKIRQPCKTCIKELEKIKRSRYKDQVKVVPDFKECCSCKETKPSSEFHVRSDTPTGLRNECKDCYNKGNREYYEYNRESVLERTGNYQKEHREDASRWKRERYWSDHEKYLNKDREYRNKNRDKINNYNKLRSKDPKVKEKLRSYAKKYRDNPENKQIIKEKSRIWRSLNKDKVAYYASSRRAKIKQATPEWADHDIIKSFYTEAQYFGESVDHIIPLSHPLVCGLHCEYNLQLLPLQENITKNNSFEPCEHELPDTIEE